MTRDDKVQLKCVFEDDAAELRLRDLQVHVPGKTSSVLTGKANWKLLAELLLCYRIRILERPTCIPVHLEEADSLLGDDFEQAWSLVKNQLNKKREKGHPAELQDHIEGITQHAYKGSPLSISIAPMRLPGGNVTFSLINVSTGETTHLTQCRQMQIVLDALTGRSGPAVRGLTGDSEAAPARQQEPFRFGNQATRTFVAHYFDDGLAMEYVECHKDKRDFEIPAELMPLVCEVLKLVSGSNNAGHVMVNAPVFALVDVDVVTNFGDDGSFQKVMIWLANSHYDFYTAAAFADTLAERDPKFQPLQRFVNQMKDSRIPSPASCSLGTRIMLETADQRLVVTYRSRDCKMNPDVWSTSANEGVRPSVLKGSTPFSNLIDAAAREALFNELRIDSGSIDYLALLSLHQNAFAQWGATIYAKTSLRFNEVVQRQSKAHHRFEHTAVKSLPVHLEECGKAMADIGTRWYGGALEAICSTLAFRELAKRIHVTPEEVGQILSDAASHRIIPVDEVNENFLLKTA